MSKTRGWLYRAARLLGDAQAITSGSPRKVGRRAKNKLLGRLMGRLGIWVKMWK